MSDSTLIQPSSLNRSNMYAYELRNSPIYCPRKQSSAFQTRQFKRRRKKTSWLKMFRELSVSLIHGPELHVKMSCYQQSTHTHTHYGNVHVLYTISQSIRTSPCWNEASQLIPNIPVNKRAKVAYTRLASEMCCGEAKWRIATKLIRWDVQSA